MPSSPKRGDGTVKRIDGFHPDVEVIYATEVRMSTLFMRAR
jgi:hypothetical protein